MTEAAQAAPIANDVPDTAIKVYAQHWVATVIVSDQDPNGFFHVTCDTRGMTPVDAFNAASHILMAYAFDREAFIRVRPECVSVSDHATGKVHHAATVRFSYKLAPGAWSYPPEETPRSFGEQH